MRVWVASLSWLIISCVSLNSTARAALAVADDLAIRGRVVDVLGATVADARVEVRRRSDDAVVTTVQTDGEGRFAIAGLAGTTYALSASADGFEQTDTQLVWAHQGGGASVVLTLRVGRIRQDVTVTAAALEVPTAQVGAAVDVLDGQRLTAVGAVDVLESLRQVAGVGVVQSGERGAPTATFIRGGSSNFNKVLVDGVALNDIGGGFDFGALANAGVGRVEVLRSANSVLYGADAMTGIVDIVTAHGTGARPAVQLGLDAGSLKTRHTDVSVGGASRGVDYFASHARLETDNAVPNADHQNQTASGRVGVSPAAGVRVTATARWNESDSGSPNAFNYFGVADDSRAERRVGMGTVAVDVAHGERWATRVHLGVVDQRYAFNNPRPTGTPSDSSAFANYLGHVVTIRGANGAQVRGRAILDYCCSFPSRFDSTMSRQVLSARTHMQAAPSVAVSMGARVEHERGTARSSFSDDETSRVNAGVFGEVRASVGHRAFVTAGVGVERNDVFGLAAVPRASVAVYARRPSTRVVGESKIVANVGQGLRAPSLDQELSALAALVPVATATANDVGPIAPERSRTVDVGLEQGFFGGRVRMHLAAFHGAFDDLIEYVGKGALSRIGVAPAAISALAFGAYVNAQANRSSGVETSVQATAGGVTLRGDYTYLSAKVTESLSSGVLAPAINPAFPGVAIGQYAPLVGARPFRRPAHSGSVALAWQRGALAVAGAAVMTGRSDDSTYLSDEFFGSSLLLPNTNLVASQRRVDGRVAYRLHRSVTLDLRVENAFDARNEAAAGYPSLPRVVRGGVTVFLNGR